MGFNPRADGKPGFNDFLNKKQRAKSSQAKVGSYRSLVLIMEKNGMNPWDARIAARRQLNMKIPNNTGVK